MTDTNIVRVPINNPALNTALTRAFGKRGGPAGSSIPKTKAEFDRLVALAEADLQPAQRGRPRKGQRGPVTRTRSIRAPETLWKRLDAMAKARGITANQVAVLAIESIAK